MGGHNRHIKILEYYLEKQTLYWLFINSHVLYVPGTIVETVGIENEAQERTYWRWRPTSRGWESCARPRRRHPRVRRGSVDCWWCVWQVVSSVQCMISWTFWWFPNCCCVQKFWVVSGCMFVPHKPKPFGNEYHSVCCGKSTIMSRIVLVEDKDTPRQIQRPFDTFKGKTTAPLLQMCAPIFGRGFLVVLDSGFYVLQALVKLKKRGVLPLLW